MNRPGLSALFKGKATKDKESRDRMIVKAVEKYGYSQKEVADSLKMHYSTVSRIMNK